MQRSLTRLQAVQAVPAGQVLLGGYVSRPRPLIACFLTDAGSLALRRLFKHCMQRGILPANATGGGVISDVISGVISGVGARLVSGFKHCVHTFASVACTGLDNTCLAVVT